MNIKQLGKLFKDSSQQEVRTLELKVGQVVRGVVTQQLPNQEALVNINGVQVRAKLEVPILEGQATLMQVAPDSKGSFIHLKQVDPTALGLSDPMKDILKAMQLPDKEWSNQLVRELRQEGFALNRDTLQALAQAAKALPANMDLENWMHAAMLAFKRGMPMTASSILAMHHISQHGQSLHQLVQTLQGQLTSLLQAQGQQNGSTVQLLQALSQQLNQLIQGQAPASSQGQQSQAGLLNNQAQAQVNQSATSQAAVSQQGQSTLTAMSHNPIASFMKMLGVQHENSLSQQIVNKGELATASNQNAQLQAQTNAGQQAATSNQNPQGQASSLQMQQAAPIASSQPQAQMGGQLSPAAQAALQNTTSLPGQQVHASSTIAQNQTATQLATNQVGQSSQTNQLNTQPAAANQVPAQPAASAQAVPTNLAGSELGNTQASGAPQQATMQQAGAGQTMQAVHSTTSNQAELHVNQVQTQLSGAINNQAADSVKATVLQALQLTDVPAAVKETLNQLLNHITGQQMLLAPERNHSMFTHVTMYVPIKDEHGGQTAAIHVQTRRDRKGQLDAENCRIVFDLNMKQLGQTLVDMNVTNKIVSLNIWNDSPIIQPLIETMRPEMFESLQKTGYSLSSIKATPFKQDEEQALVEARAIVQPPDIQHINAARYKGVDLKI